MGPLILGTLRLMMLTGGVMRNGMKNGMMIGLGEEEHASSEPPTLAPAEEEDEQAAEQLAMEAKRTWVEAQHTTQQVRKDRGFGQHGPSSTRCFNCWWQPLCPRLHRQACTSVLWQGRQEQPHGVL